MPYSVAPWVIGVAAGCKLVSPDPTISAIHCADQTGQNRAPILADFSSRGVAGDPLYHPDITAPGVHIVSTRASTGTVLNGLDANHDLNLTSTCAISATNEPFYTCASGTSMATPPAAGARDEGGWRAYRAGDAAEAVRRFSAADSLCPGEHGAQVGLGFALFRLGRAQEAAGRFLLALRSDAADADAWYGLGLARARLGDRRQAVLAWRRALRAVPGYPDAEQELLALGLHSGLALPAARRGPEPQVPARTAGDGFEVRAADGWRPFYVKGVNLGAALPGKFPSEFPGDDSTHARWLRLMPEAHANTVRLYTILPPAFYRAFRQWNEAHPDRALWLVHGVWAEPPPGNDYDAVSWKAEFRAEMRRVVDLVHGRARIGARPGHAFGRYDADVADHVLAYLIGREWEPHSIERYNARRRGRTGYAGRFLTIDRGAGTPADAG